MGSVLEAEGFDGWLWWGGGGRSGVGGCVGHGEDDVVEECVIVSACHRYVFAGDTRRKKTVKLECRPAVLAISTVLG